MKLTDDVTPTVVEKARTYEAVDILHQGEAAAVADACHRYPGVMATAQDAGNHEVMCRGLMTFDVMVT